jgi:phosphatidate cytidylyltransferase
VTASPAPRRRSDLGIRVVTGLVLAVVALGCLVVGTHYWWVLVLAAALAMMVEWAALVRAERWQTWLAIIGLFAALLAGNPHFDVPPWAPLAVLGAATLLVLILTRAPRLGAGMLYAGLPALSLLFLQIQFNGVDLTLWTLAIVWATDIGAYFAGRRFGGPKLAPVLSPNKTWSGLIGGVAAAVIVGVGLSHLLHVALRLAVCAGVLAIAAQAGDIYESGMKRRAGVKDSGRILPGHGGVMDRLDGLVPVSCLVALAAAAGLA